MEKRRNVSYEQVSRRVNRIRRLYSAIGEPLDANIIIDLHRQLGGALRLAQSEASPRRGRKKRLS